ncbi:hypothetical protein [Planktothrix agardhii]|nr:hypothetical protein [Planktothrix agardhii]MCF3578796.1 hypothetical protein [Planktothrix agardhii 1812]
MGDRTQVIWDSQTSAITIQKLLVQECDRRQDKPFIQYKVHNYVEL